MPKHTRFFDTDKSRQNFLNDLRQTAEYRASKNKDRFTAAAFVGYSLIAVEADRDLVELYNRVESAERKSEEALTDLETLGTLLKKYAKEY